MTHRLRIFLLGGLRVESGDRVFTRFRTRKTGSLLAFLAYQTPLAVPRGVLIEHFWPEDPPEKGRASLNTALSSLRQQLGSFATLPDTFLVADRHSVKLNEGLVWTDVGAFRRAASTALRVDGQRRAASLREALDLYRGDLLEGFYDEWILPRVVELGEIHDALVDLEAKGALRESPKAAESQPGEVARLVLDNLPRIANPFVGRGSELERLAHLNGRAPLVVVTGMGGVGKTRLAIEFGSQLRNEAKEVWLIELAAAPPDASLAEEILRQLEIPSTEHLRAIEALERHFRDRRATLLLDNLEHLDDPEREMHALVQRLSTTAFVATSRTRLKLAAAEVLELSPLPVPLASADLEALRANPSANLFVDRAASAAPGFTLNPRNADAVRELCQKLEGISLAIELAAARAQVYSVREMVEQMDRPLEFLVSRVKDRADRHRSLRSTIQWSYRNLSPWARDLLPKLALAKGGWTLAMSGRVFPDGGLADRLQEMIDASLLTASEAGSNRHFTMHQVVREFGLELLTPDVSMDVQRKRLDAMCDFVSIDGPGAGSELGDWLERIDSELENVRDLLDWAWRTGEEERAVKLATGLHTYWERRSRFREGSEWLERAIEIDTLPKELRASVLRSAGEFRMNFGDYGGALENMKEAAALFDGIGDRVLFASVLNSIGNVLNATGRYAEAEAYYTQSLEERRRENDPSRLGIPLVNLANAAVSRAQYREAEALYMEALSIGRAREDRFLIQGTLNNLATMLIRMGRLGEVAPMLDEAGSINESIGHPHGAAHVLLSRAELLYRKRRFEEAAAMALKSLEAFEAISEVLQIGHLRVLMAKLDLMCGQTRRAEERLRRVAGGLNRVEDRRLLAETESLLAIPIGERDRRGAAVVLLRALDRLRVDPDAPELFRVLVIAGSLLGGPDSDSLMGVAQRFYADTGTEPEPLIAERLRPGRGDVSPGQALELALRGCESLGL